MGNNEEEYSEEDFGKCVKVGSESAANTQSDDDKIYETLKSAMEKLKELRGAELCKPEPIIILSPVEVPAVKKSMRKRNYKITRNGFIKRTMKGKILDWLCK